MFFTISVLQQYASDGRSSLTATNAQLALACMFLLKCSLVLCFFVSSILISKGSTFARFFCSRKRRGAIVHNNIGSNNEAAVPQPLRAHEVPAAEDDEEGGRGSGSEYVVDDRPMPRRNVSTHGGSTSLSDVDI